jgi:glycosyltransferase involved in cell wall biosynthesis
VSDKTPHISYVIPAYNEQAGIAAFYQKLNELLRTQLADYDHEIVFVNDGSTDRTLDKLEVIAHDNPAVRVVTLSRNFGKEMALAAGIATATGDAIMTIDADGQFPVECIPEFITKWRDGADVVIGVRTSNHKEGFVKRYGSKLFYRLINAMPDVRLVPGSTDFRLIDKVVQQDFIQMSERNRITRGLIDWLGYNREYVHFAAKARAEGEATQSFAKLFALTIDSFISLSKFPLYLAAYLGAFLVPGSMLVLLGMIIDNLAGDPLGLRATGSAYVIVGLVGLVGVLLVSQGILGMYLSHIHTESQARPLYVINKKRSINL